MLLEKLISKGGQVMWPLLALGLISVVLIADRIAVLCIYSIKKGNCSLKPLRFVSLMELIAQSSPVLGFLGTVVGIMASFKSLSLSTDVSIQSVSGGMYQALFTTAAGLVISIVDSVCAQLFRWWAEYGSKSC